MQVALIITVMILVMVTSQYEHFKTALDSKSGGSKYSLSSNK